MLEYKCVGVRSGADPGGLGCLKTPIRLRNGGGGGGGGVGGGGGGGGGV